MKRILILFILVLGGFVITQSSWAQDTHLQIGKVIQKLTDEDNTVCVTMKGKKVAQYNLTYFKSIAIEHPNAYQIERIEQAIRKDASSITNREERTSGSHIAYGFYCLTPNEKGQNRYVFYTNNSLLGKSGYKVTLIYLEGKATLTELKKHFKK